MTIDTARKTANIFTLLLLILSCILFSCTTETKCHIPDDGKALQSIRAQNLKVNTYLIEQGAFGSVVSLQMCDLEKGILIEEITLRGDDDLPHVDSVRSSDIYISYPYSATNKADKLEFESVVLGDALIHKEELKYNYIFTNVKKDEEGH